MITVDAVVFRQTSKRLEVLVIRRKNPPYAKMLALPGGFVDMEEDLLNAAKRELFEETGLRGLKLSQLRAFGKPDRDPRGRNISIAFVGVLRKNASGIKGCDDATEALWMPARRCPKLAFDHSQILSHALQWLKNLKIKTSLIA